jgi:hypothetical protein
MYDSPTPYFLAGTGIMPAFATRGSTPASQMYWTPTIEARNQQLGALQQLLGMRSQVPTVDASLFRNTGLPRDIQQDRVSGLQSALGNSAYLTDINRLQSLIPQLFEAYGSGSQIAGARQEMYNQKKLTDQAKKSGGGFLGGILGGAGGLGGALLGGMLGGPLGAAIGGTFGGQLGTVGGRLFA